MKKKITICSSAVFFDKILDLKKELELLGFEVLTPITEGAVTDYSKYSDAEKRNLKKMFIEAHVKKIKKSDAILVANYMKNSIPGYIGGNVFLEMGFAFALEKNIFLLNEIPEQGNKVEIMGMSPIVINGKLGLIKNHLNK